MRSSREDPLGRVAVETLVTTGLVHVAGEVSTRAYVEIPAIVRDVVNRIGYTSSEAGFDGESCGVSVSIGAQSSDIAAGVNKAFERREDGSEDPHDLQGAGDQGIMFGYATTETPQLMPMAIWTAHRIAERLSAVRRDGSLGFLRPDGKTQVTLGYDGADAEDRRIGRALHPAPPRDLAGGAPGARARRGHRSDPRQTGLDLPAVKYYINPAGPFVTGGPKGDAGLTGRKIIIDTYGGASRHGGGAFSGKDPSKVDRSAAYAMRWVAKNAVAAGLAERLEVQVAYAIGKANPVGLYVESFGTGHVPDETITRAILECLRPPAEGDHRSARSAASDLRADGRLRPLRARAARVHLGAHRSRRGAPRGRRDLTWSASARGQGVRALGGALVTAARPRGPIVTARRLHGCCWTHRCRSSIGSSTTPSPEWARRGRPARASVSACPCAQPAASSDGFLVERGAPEPGDRPLSELDAVVSPARVLPMGLYTLARRVADRAAGSASDILRLVIPKRMVRAEKAWIGRAAGRGARRRRRRRAWATACSATYPGLADGAEPGRAPRRRSAAHGLAAPADGAGVGAWAELLAAAAVATLARGPQRGARRPRSSRPGSARGRPRRPRARGSRRP